MFDLARLTRKKQLFKARLAESDFFNFIYNDIIDNIWELGRDFPNILIIDYFDSDILRKSLTSKHPKASFDHITPLQLTCPNISTKYDLVIFPFGLHWIYDVKNILINIKNLLNKNGTFIANLPADGSLKNLKKELIIAEDFCNMPHFSRFIPMIKFDHISSLLLSSGLQEVVVNIEKIELEHQNPIRLMKDLQKYAENNFIENRASYSFNKKIYQYLSDNTRYNPFIDQVELATISCVLRT